MKSVPGKPFPPPSDFPRNSKMLNGKNISEKHEIFNYKVSFQ
jgi:hypothetical protein